MKSNFATMTETEVSSFVKKFGDLLHAGQKASLVMECDNGYARVNMEVYLQPNGHQQQQSRGASHRPGHHHPHQHARHPPQHTEGRPGPSRLR